MLSPLPRHSDWVPVSLTSPVVPAFPAWVDGSTCATSFSRIAQRSLTLRPAHSPSHLVTLYTRGFSHFVTSMTAPIASGWSEICRVGLSPTGKRRLSTAHTQGRPSAFLPEIGHSIYSGIRIRIFPGPVYLESITRQEFRKRLNQR